MGTVSPEKVAELISTASKRRRLAEDKRKPFLDAGWNQYQADVFTFVGDFRVDASYKIDEDQFELFVYTDPVVRERFETAHEALDWFDKLRAAIDLDD